MKKKLPHSTPVVFSALVEFPLVLCDRDNGMMVYIDGNIFKNLEFRIYVCIGRL